MTRSLRASLSVLASLTMLACGEPATGSDAGVAPEDACATCADAAPSDSGPADGGRTSNDSFATATPITIDADPAAAEVISPATDTDYFRFEGTAGDWVVVYTTSEMPASGNRVDTVITLFDAAMTQIAENDDAQPRADTDSEIIIRLPATGTYYYEVQEFSTWDPAMAMDGPQGGASYAYETGVNVLTSETPRVTIDAETGDDMATAAPLVFVSNAAFALGRLDDATDVDVFSFTSTASAGSPRSLRIEVMPSGPMGYGSPRSAGRLWITDATGAIFARGTIGGEATNIQPSLATAGQLFLWVEGLAGAAGANDHYVVKAFYTAENPRELGEPNDTLATAEVRPLAPIDGETGENTFLLARLPGGDVDFYSFDVVAGREVSVACGSRLAGSGVIGLVGELQDSSGAVLAMSTETDTDNLFIDSVAVPAGTYVLRLSAASQDPVVTGDWVRCGVTAAPPAPAP